MAVTPTADQFAGCLVGECVGDALGFPVEGMGADVCRRHVEDRIRPRDLSECARGGFAFGQYSDDSQLARELMASFADCGGFDPADYGRRIAAIFTEGRIVGRGRSTEEAAMRLAAGVPWDQAGTPAPSAGNGSAMRAGPVGVLFHHDTAAMAGAAHDQGRITHADPRCSAGAVAIAGAVLLAARRQPIDAEAMCAQLAESAAAHDGGFARLIGRLPAWLALEPKDAAAEIGHAGGAPGEGRDGISPFVVSSVLWSLYAFLRHPNDYLDAVCTAILCGGDVDTTAAMTGAIAGARAGLDGIPRDLAETINDQGEWWLDDLVALAERCHAITSGRR